MNGPPTRAEAGASPGTGKTPPRVDLSMADLAVILEHARTALSDAECGQTEVCGRDDRLLSGSH